MNPVVLDTMQRCMLPPKTGEAKRGKKLREMVAVQHTRSPVPQRDIDLYLLGRLGPTVVAYLRQSEAEVISAPLSHSLLRVGIPLPFSSGTGVMMCMEDGQSGVALDNVAKQTHHWTTSLFPVGLVCIGQTGANKSAVQGFAP